MTGGSPTVTAALCVIAVVTSPSVAVAETVFSPNTVDVRVPVASPFAPVGPGCVTVVPGSSGATVRATVAPLIGRPKASFTVTVMVDWPPFEIEVGDAVTVDWVADTPAPAEWHA